jgi:hypothetical protein
MAAWAFTYHEVLAASYIRHSFNERKRPGQAKSKRDDSVK